jgi:hypothetical protein
MSTRFRVAGQRMIHPPRIFYPRVAPANIGLSQNKMPPGLLSHLQMMFAINGISGNSDVCSRFVGAMFTSDGLLVGVSDCRTA